MSAKIRQEEININCLIKKLQWIRVLVKSLFNRANSKYLYQCIVVCHQINSHHYCATHEFYFSTKRAIMQTQSCYTNSRSDSFWTEFWDLKAALRRLSWKVRYSFRSLSGERQTKSIEEEKTSGFVWTLMDPQENIWRISSKVTRTGRRK